MGRCNVSWRGCCWGGSLGRVGDVVRCDVGRRCYCWRVGVVVVGVGVVVVTVVRVVIGVVTVVVFVDVVIVVVAFVVVAAVAAEPPESHPDRAGLVAGVGVMVV